MLESIRTSVWTWRAGVTSGRGEPGRDSVGRVLELEVSTDERRKKKGQSKEKELRQLGAMGGGELGLSYDTGSSKSACR